MIGRELGRGVTGRVYVAEDAMLARPVAIKFISRLDAGARQRFLLEARAVAQIHHPNVVGIYRVGTHENRPYFVTELVRGQSLAEIHKPMAWEFALDIGIGLARGLAAAHRRNVVHCDLKPSNVMLDADGVAKIIDFGLARFAADGMSAAHTPVGTPDYMAPEVWSGEVPGRRADVYSLGAMLFELLTARPPFGDVPPPELRQRVTTSEAPRVRELSPEVDPAFADVVARCLRRDRATRYADGDELREALERLHSSRRHSIPVGENPYRGLLPFNATHRGVFFGRRSEVDAVVGRLRSEPIVLVTGDSGVGKSSLCRAGVVPAVVDGELGGDWHAVAIVPGQRPLTALALALGDLGLVPRLHDEPGLLARELRRCAGDRGLIVFIDQLEELITLGDPDEVAALDAGLAGMDGVPGLRLLATVRADFLARISTLPGLGRDLSRLLYFLRPLPPERLRDVIIGPAAAVGARFESDAIVDDLIAATAQAGSGGLPLLSFALADLWEARDRADDMISRNAVTAMGGVAGALSRHADVVIGGMVAAERSQARAVLLRLVTAMGTRARRAEHELVLDEAARSALDALVRGRLVVVHDGEPEPEYELAHECLLTGWGTLRQWLDADTAGRATRERLATASAEWVRLGRRSDATWQGTRLHEALLLDPANLSADDRAFLAASRRAARRRRRQRWLGTFGAIMIAVLAFSTQRYLAQRQLAAEVTAELRQARAARALAHEAERNRAELVVKAFSEFDARKWEDGERVWGQVVAQHDTAERAYRDASRHVETAFAKDALRGDVRDLTSDILIDRATLAEQVHDMNQRDELIERLPVYDDGSHLKRWQTPGHVVVRATAGATITLEPSRVLGTGTADVSLAPGSYVIAISAPGRVVVRAPVLVERNGDITINTAPPRLEDVPQGFVYVPAGEFLYGNASDADRLTFFVTTPLRRRYTPAFLISRTEVTFEEWLEYVDALPAAERARRIPRVPIGVNGGVAITPDDAGHWRIELALGDRRYAAGWDEPIIYTGRTRHVMQNWRRFPVIGVSADDAAAYAAWLSDTGRVPRARVCSEVEWERAARGADGRGYPGGRPLEPDDANYDVTYTFELMGPDEVGLHPASRSPFGLDDMSGNVFEWTISEQGGYILRSGSYQHDRKTAHLTNRSPMNALVRDTMLGIRLCATPPLPR